MLPFASETDNSFVTLFCRRNKFFLFWVSSRVRGVYASKVQEKFQVLTSKYLNVKGLMSFVMLVFELQEIFIWQASDSPNRVEMDFYSGRQGIFSPFFLLGLPFLTFSSGM